jgi:hypothetical protein
MSCAAWTALGAPRAKVIQITGVPGPTFLRESLQAAILVLEAGALLYVARPVSGGRWRWVSRGLRLASLEPRAEEEKVA